MSNPRTHDELRRLQRSALDGAAIGRMIAAIENELGYALYDAVGRLKRTLSDQEQAHFHFSGGGLEIEAEVPEGLERSKVRTLVENANTLGFIEKSLE